MLEITNFTPLEVENNNVNRSNCKGVLTIINSKKNGKRLMLSQELKDILEIQDNKVSLGFDGIRLVLGTNLPGNDNQFNLKPLGKKYVIYSAAVVNAISERQKIDFTDRVSHTWYEPIIDEYQGRPVVMFEREGGAGNE